MDPVTGANTLATIVQLIGIFAQERKDKKNAERQEFLEWLEYHRHEDIKNLICNTAALQTEVLSLLQKDNATILTKLDSINATIGGLLSHVHGFESLTKTMIATPELSDQAVSVLRQGQRPPALPHKR